MLNYIGSKSVSHCSVVWFGVIALALAAMPLSSANAGFYGVVIEPEWPDSDEFISITAWGWYPETCWEINGSSFSQSGDTIRYYINGAPNWFIPCFFMIIPYSHTRILDPLPMGSYTLIVYDGTGQSIDTVFHVSPWLCCEGIRGNIDGDSDDQIDIADLVYLVDYMFNDGPPPLCATEADLDADGQTNISDLVHLVDYMFNGGPPPVDCP